MKRILVSYYWQILIIATLLALNIPNSNGTEERTTAKPSFNYTEFMINHLRSKGSFSQRRNHRNRPDPIEETSTQPSIAEAEDRIFFKPYHFPFWGGFFNPELFPFVPGGPGFPPFDGIFGSPFGPGKFPGKPTPFQGFANSSMSTSTAATTSTLASASALSSEDAKVSNDSTSEGRTKRYPRAPGYPRKKRRRRPCCYPTTTPAPEEDDHYYPEESDEGYHAHDSYETVMERPNYPKYMATEPPSPPPSYHKPQYHNSYKEQQRPSSSYENDQGPQTYSIPMTPPKPKYRHQPNQSSPKYRQRPPPYKPRRPAYDQTPEKKKRPPSNSQWYRSRPKPPLADYPPRYSPEDIPSPYDEEHHYTHSYSNEQPYYSYNPPYWNPVTPPTTTAATTVATTTAAPYTTPAPYNSGHSPVILNVSPCQLYSLANLLSPQCSTSTPTTTQTPPQVTNSYDRSDSSSTITISLPYQYWLYPPPEYTTPRPQYSIPPSLLESVTPPPKYATPPPPHSVYPAPLSVPQYVQAHPPVYATPPVSPSLTSPSSAYHGYYPLPSPQEAAPASTTSAPHPQPLYFVLPPWVTPPGQYGHPTYNQQAPPAPATTIAEKDTKPQQIIYLLSPPHHSAVVPPSGQPPPYQPIYPTYPPAQPTPLTQHPPTTETPPVQPQPVYIMYSPHSSHEPPPPNYVHVKSDPEAATTTPPVQPIYIMYPPQTKKDTPDAPPPEYSATTTEKPLASPQPIYVIYTPHTDESPNVPPKILPSPYPGPSGQPTYPKTTSQGYSDLPTPAQQPTYVYARPAEETSTQDPPTYDKPPPSNYVVAPPQSDPETPPQKPLYAIYAHQPKTTAPSFTSSAVPTQPKYFEPPPQPTYVKPTQFVYDEPPSQQIEDTPPEFRYSLPPPYHSFKYPPPYFQRHQSTSTYSRPPSSNLDTPAHPYVYSTPPPKPTLDTPPMQFTYSPTLKTPPLNAYSASPPKPTLDIPPVQFTYSTPSRHKVDTPPETIYVRPTPIKSTFDDSLYLSPVTHSSDYDNIQNIHGPPPSQSESLETPSPHDEQHDDDIYPRYPVYNFDTPMNHESTSPLKVYSAYAGSRHVRTQPHSTTNSTNHVSIVYPERSSPSNYYSPSYPRGRKYPSSDSVVSEPHESSGFTFHQDPIPSESRTYPRTTARRVKSYVFDTDPETNHQINRDDPHPQSQEVRGLNIHLAPNSNVYLSSSGTLSVEGQNNNSVGIIRSEVTKPDESVSPGIKSLSSPFENSDSEGQIVSSTGKSTQVKPGTLETQKNTTNVTVKPSNAHQYSLSS